MLGAGLLIAVVGAPFAAAAAVRIALRLTPAEAPWLVQLVPRLPVTFYPLAGKMIPWFAAMAAALAAAGLYIGLVVAPTDFQQGDAYRIIFIHVPAAWMSMFIYLVMADSGARWRSASTRGCRR